MKNLLAYLVAVVLCVQFATVAPAQKVRVMQWNIHDGLGTMADNSTAQAAAIARIVNYNQPDVLLLNEVNTDSIVNNQAALTAWVTNNLPYMGALPGVTFFVAVSSKTDTFNRNCAISRYPILTPGTYTSTLSLRGLHSFKVQLAGTNALQIFHAHFKCCGSLTSSECSDRQAEATFASSTIRAWAATNSLPYIFAGDWNEDESNPQCTLSSTYRPITMVRTNGNLTEFVPINPFNGVSKTISSTSPNRRFDYSLAASNRLSAVSGYVFNSASWGSQYTSVIPGSSTGDSITASDHLNVLVTYSFPTSATNFNVIPSGSFDSGGPAGGPFLPSSQVYTLTNSEAIPLFWSVTKTSNWLTVTPPATNLTLGAGRSTNITVSINSAANLLTPATYFDTIKFSNTATGVSISRGVSLAVGASPPTANFSGSPTNGVEPLIVTFTDTSTGNINNRFWDFGDGSTTNVTTNVVVHSYAGGSFDVTLIASGVGGAGTNSLANYINVITPFQEWQILYFGSTNNAAGDASSDPDGDGQDNISEFLSGTNPTNNASAFRITSVEREGTNLPPAVRITWSTVGGKTNAVEAGCGSCLDDPTTGSYTNVFINMSGSIIIPGSGTVVTNYLDDGSFWGDFTNAPAYYYRIRLVP